MMSERSSKFSKSEPHSAQNNPTFFSSNHLYPIHSLPSRAFFRPNLDPIDTTKELANAISAQTISKKRNPAALRAKPNPRCFLA